MILNMKEEMRMDIISNNIANINVIGFKRTRISFRDMLEAAGGQAGQGDEMSVNSGIEVCIRKASSYCAMRVAISGSPVTSSRLRLS